MWREPIKNVASTKVLIYFYGTRDRSMVGMNFKKVDLAKNFLRILFKILLVLELERFFANEYSFE